VAFAGKGHTRTVVGWRLARGEKSARHLADQIADAFPVVFSEVGKTAIGDAVAWSIGDLATSGFEGAAKMDVSGDGRSTSGVYPGPERDRAVAAWITINGLAILNEEPYLGGHYRLTVIGGPGAFVLSADDCAAFAEAMRRKLRRELASEPTAVRRPI
jgi:hypothetical protein